MAGGAILLFTKVRPLYTSVTVVEAVVDMREKWPEYRISDSKGSGSSLPLGAV